MLSLLQGTPYLTEARGFRSHRRSRPWLSLAEGQAPPQLRGLTDNPHLEKWKQNLRASKTLKESAEGANEIAGAPEGQRPRRGKGREAEAECYKSDENLYEINGANEGYGYVSEGLSLREIQDHPAQTRKLSEGDQ